MKGKKSIPMIILGVFLCAFLMLSGQAAAAPPAMNTYCAVPPFLASATHPNIMVILDNSGSMEWAAYSSGFDPSQFANGYYYGYFDPTKNYRYETAVTPNRWVPTSADISTGTAANPIASGNLLNWATMKRVDVSKKLLIGGRASSPSGAYNVADRTTSPVKLYGHDQGSFNKNYTSPTTAPYRIYPFTGDYNYRVSGGSLEISSNVAGSSNETRRPTSDITTGAWTTSSGSARWDMVDETGNGDGDSTYIQNTTSSTNDQVIFGYNKSAFGISGTISDVTVFVRAKKIHDSTRRIRAAVRMKEGSGNVDYFSDYSDIDTSYRLYSFSFATNPSTGAAWTFADLTGSAVGSMEGFGVDAYTTPTSSRYPRVTQVYITVTVTAPSGTYNIVVDQGSTSASGILDTMAGDVRFGLAYYNSSAQGGNISSYVNFNSAPAMISNISSMDPSTWTPLAETLYEVTRYFRQDSTYTDYSSTDYIKGCSGATSGTSTCTSGAAPTTRDPYFFDFPDAGTPDGYVPCAKSFVLFLTDGESTQDQNIPGSSTSSPYAACSLTNIKACSGAGGLPNPRYAGTAIGTTYDSSGTDYLIDVAYWARTSDTRPGACSSVSSTWSQCLPGTQNVTLYPVFLFGAGSTLLKDAAIYGGFEDLNGNNKPDCTTIPEECYRDSNNDGIVRSNGSDDPITYFEGDDGYKLEQSITSAINAILVRTSSGTAASVLASGEGSGANLVQSIFYPKRSFVGNAEVSWIGTLANMWYFIDQNLTNSSIREDTVADGALKLRQDRIVEYTFNPATYETGMNLFADANGDGIKDGSAVATADMDTLKYLWESGRSLFQRTAGYDNPGALYSASGRTIYTNTNDDATLDPFSSSNAATLRPLLGLATNTDASELIKYIRGNDGVTVDLDGNGSADAVRSRTVTVNIGGSNVTSTWKLGDIINSTPKIVSWTPLNQYDTTYEDLTYKSYYQLAGYKNRGMVFVGGNDGMLHAIKLGHLGVYNEADRKATLGKYCSITTTKGCSQDSDCPSGQSCLTDANIGKEAWAFIPKNSLPYLLYQAKADYCHLYYVDASPVVFDASIEEPGIHTGDYWTQTKSSTSWRTVLIGGMRYGGACRSNGTSCSECVTTPISGNSVGLSSYFALDITDPERPTLLWEYADSALGFSSTGPAVLRINAKSYCSLSTGTSCNSDGNCPTGQTCLQDKNKNGRWFVVLGSGPSGYISPTSRQFIGVSEHNEAGNTNGNIRLHVLDLKTGALVRSIDAGEAAAFAGSFANGTIDMDGDYSDDALYFGFTAMNTLGANKTTQAGSTIGTIRLNASETATSGAFNGKFVHRKDGIHETKLIINYDGATKTATVDSDWKSGVPAAGITYNILDGWNTGGVKRLFTKESIDPADWAVSDVIRTTGPVTSAVAKLLNKKTHEMRLYFGTGRYFYKIGQIVDNATALSRLYGVKEPCYTSSGLNSACATTVSESSLGAAFSAADTNTDGSTDTFGNVNIDGSDDPEGWFIPLQAAFGANGAERNVSDSLATTIGVVFFSTTKPSTDVCTFGGKSYIWAVRYDTGGTVTAGVLKGKAMQQLSTGAIGEVSLSNAFNAQGNRRTAPGEGMPPVDQGLNVPVPPKPLSKILHMQKK